MPKVKRCKITCVKVFPFQQRGKRVWGCALLNAKYEGWMIRQSSSKTKIIEIAEELSRFTGIRMKFMDQPWHVAD
jgi:hypothetical protein